MLAASFDIGTTPTTAHPLQCRAWNVLGYAKRRVVFQDLDQAAREGTKQVLWCNNPATSVFKRNAGSEHPRDQCSRFEM
ncbi:hypothetical protein ACRE_089370 [Hapsidospora chrysogenum ATCC 11550]|uniref:Uncharacterized protein n=1 Tax=Hapsidospora chrysogenum (strain ATCC 11550 / CBS 779.69 / DSM 880 / IAM 14645 / JCM 23072 / IMI 49137) TaxID=857340 RepID=A0A086STG8_HAPC1|nr:hypothetical protein ACRE_089370 [Hapsidospora chrysogenum ATCC 11550]